MKKRVLMVMLLQSLCLQAMKKNENLAQIPESYQSMENFKNIKKDSEWYFVPLEEEHSDNEGTSNTIYSSKKNKSECCCLYFFRKKRDNGNLLKS